MKKNKIEIPQKNNNKFLFYANLIVLVIVLIAVVFHIIIHTHFVGNKIIFRDKNNASYRLTSPILDCENLEQGSGSILSYLDVSKKIDELENKYNIKDSSFYFRDLNNGMWLGVNEKETFSPASLLKTPIVMALYKYAEVNPEILNKEVLITEEDTLKDSNQNITFDNVLQKDKTYTLAQIAESVIVNSDNSGVRIILGNIPEEYVKNIFSSIGVPYKDLSNEVDLRVKDYAGFFRVLFNSSYLERDTSEKVLEILSRSKYKNGLVAGVPEGVTVAHKFGERKVNNVHQFHDCGIVYQTDMPYLICVMTRGDKFENEQSFIRDVSAYVYQEVDKNKDK